MSNIAFPAYSWRQLFDDVSARSEMCARAHEDENGHIRVQLRILPVSYPQRYQSDLVESCYRLVWQSFQLLPEEAQSSR
jgi:hypothetical protein